MVNLTDGMFDDFDPIQPPLPGDDSAAYDEPLDYDAGLDFSYELWTPDSVVTLTNVPWDANYRDLPAWSATKTPDAYIDGRTTKNVQITDVSYVKPNLPVKLPLGINQAQGFNYLRVVNPSSTNPDETGMVYYYFITSTEWDSPGSTRFVLQLDVWTTFGRRATVGNAYVERGHIGIANENQFDNYGRDYLTIPEGRDMGSEYRHMLRSSRSVMSRSAGSETNNEITILMVMAINLELDPGTETNPKVVTATGSNMQGLPSGASIYAFQSIAQLQVFMQAFQYKPWVTQSIMSITAVPGVQRYGYEYVKFDIPNVSTVNIFKVKAVVGQGNYYNMFGKWRDELRAKLPSRYRHLSKFLVSPYTIGELTANTGAPLILKPELWDSETGRITEKAVYMPPNQRVSFYPVRYNAQEGFVQEERNNDGHIDYYDDGGEYLNMMVSIGSFPSFPIVNNGAIGALAAQRNSIQYQRDAADWSQQRALAGNQTGYDQASAGMATTGEQGRISRNADIAGTGITNDMAGLSAVSQGGMSIAGGLSSGNPVGAAGGVLGATSAYLGYAVTTTGNSLQLANRNSAAVAQQGAALGLSGYMRDTNKDLADWSARGDYANTIAGINAKVQDLKMTQPSVSGQSGGEAFNMVHDAATISLRIKSLAKGEMRSIGDYWLRYGYAVQQFVQFSKLPKDLMVMSKFTYWKLTETYLTGDMPEQFKQALRGILEKGATLWASPDDIGMIDIADNEPLKGIKL